MNQLINQQSVSKTAHSPLKKGANFRTEENYIHHTAIMKPLQK